MKDKTFSYINESYGKQFKHGLIVRIADPCKEQFGMLEYGNSHVFVRVEGKVQGGFHPNDIQLLDDYIKTKNDVQQKGDVE